MSDSSSSSSCSFSTSSLVVRKLDHRSDSLSYPLIDLPHNYKKSVSELVHHIKSIIEANEKHHHRKCEEFYIGKSTIKQRGEDFDLDKPSTWKLKWINQRWDARRKHGYQAMAVLTVVTKDTLPYLESRRPAEWKQQYTIALEQGLITHFMFVGDDERLANETTEPGNLDRSGAIAYVLYLAMKFGPKLVVPLHELSFFSTKLPNKYLDKSVSKLVDRIESIIAANEKYHHRTCKGFYIGKSTIYEQSRRYFDPDKPHTWDTGSIKKHWSTHGKDGYQAMAVLTVVTYETLPLSRYSRQNYTLDLKKNLIKHFWCVDDKRLTNETTGSGRLAESGAAYVLYLAMKFLPKWVIPLKQYSFSLIDLPKHYKKSKSVSELVDRIESIIAANEKYHHRMCKGFYIGKSTIHEQSRRYFDPDKPHTWDTGSIKKHWSTRRNNGYQAMAVLTVVTYETLPPDESQESPQQYTLDLKKELIKHFRDEKDKRLKNTSTAPGKPSSDGAAYVLYLAIEFEDESKSESDSGSDS